MTAIVHLVPSDEKFLDMAAREFEAAAPGLHRWVCLGTPRQERLARLSVVETFSLAELRRLLRGGDYRAVVIHYLDCSREVIGSVPSRRTVAWIGWGGDYYERLLAGAYPNGLLLPGTRALVDRAPKPGALSRGRAALLTAARLATGRSVLETRALLRRVDLFAPVLDVEYDLARSLNPWFPARYAAWNYGTVEDDFLEDGPPGPLGRDILVGNSATPTNNHLEVFDLLAGRTDLGRRRIVVPLSYGDPWYRDRIVEAGQARFGKQFVPVTEFLRNDAWLALVRGCGTMINNHVRQQALGNICIKMLQGTRMWMHRDSPVVRWLRARGAEIGVTDALGSAPSPWRALPEPARAANVEVIRGHWGRDVQRARTRSLVEMLLGEQSRD